MTDIAHHGVKGMRWGIRKLRRSSTTHTSGLTITKRDTPANRKTLTDDELRARIQRIELETKYAQLTAKKRPVLDRGRKALSDAFFKAFQNTATLVLKTRMEQIAKELSLLDENSKKKSDDGGKKKSDDD